MTADAFMHLDCPRWGVVRDWFHNDDYMDSVRRPEGAPAVNVPGLALREAQKEPEIWELTAAQRIDRAIAEMLKRACKAGRAPERRRGFKKCAGGSFDPELVRAMFEEAQRREERKKKAEEDSKRWALFEAKQRREERKRKAAELAKQRAEDEERKALERLEVGENKERQERLMELRGRLAQIWEAGGRRGIYLAETEKLGSWVLFSDGWEKAQALVTGNAEKYGTARVVRRLQFEDWVLLIWKMRNPDP